jgi:hypothetical protein
VAKERTPAQKAGDQRQRDRAAAKRKAAAAAKEKKAKRQDDEKKAAGVRVSRLHHPGQR